MYSKKYGRFESWGAEGENTWNRIALKMTVVLAVMQLPGSVIIFLCKPHVSVFLFVFKQIKTGINTRFN